MADQTAEGADRGERSSLDLDALAVSDRFRLFNFTRRDDHIAYLWVLRALDRLRGVHQVQAHTDDVAAALAELAAVFPEVPRLDSGLREKLDALAEDGMLHRLEDASRAGSLARYRNRQSVYQFSELGYRAFAAVEDVLRARIRDANLSRLVFSDILDDLKALAAATRASDREQVYRRLSRLDTVLDDMSRRAAQFHLTLGEIIRSTDTSPDTFLRYKNALLTHMTDFMTELDRYLPRLAAAVDVLDWLADRGALRLSDGSLESWAADAERGDALYDIDHDICTALFRPARPLQHLTSAAGLLDSTFVSAKRSAQREAAAQRAARVLLEYPVVYFAQVEPEIAEALRQAGVAENLTRLTGLAAERRAEGIMLADAGGRFTDRPFPGRGGAVNRAAGLLLAKIADLIEDPDEALTTLPVPAEAEDQRDLLARIDSALPVAGVVQELAWSAPADVPDEAERAGLPAQVPLLAAPFVAQTRLRAMIGELYDELGADSFTVTWKHDPPGLLAAALSFLADLRLLRPVPGGVLVLPAAARYRNIKLALPVRHADGQLALDLGAGDSDE